MSKRKKKNKKSHICETPGCGAYAKIPEFGLRKIVGGERVMIGKRSTLVGGKSMLLCRDCACGDMPITEDDREAAMRTGGGGLGDIGLDKVDNFGLDAFSAGLDKYMQDKHGVKIKRSSRGPVTVRT